MLADSHADAGANVVYTIKDLSGFHVSGVHRVAASRLPAGWQDWVLWPASHTCLVCCRYMGNNNLTGTLPEAWSSLSKFTDL